MCERVFGILTHAAIKEFHSVRTALQRRRVILPPLSPSGERIASEQEGVVGADENRRTPPHPSVFTAIMPHCQCPRGHLLTKSLQDVKRTSKALLYTYALFS
jgi:hypothetical protein